MRLLIAALAMALMIVSAQAQSAVQAPINSAAQLGSHAGSVAGAKTENTTKVKANEKAYNAALRNLPDKQYDPWHGVR
jgi:opacity protein-like surface antigen